MEKFPTVNHRLTALLLFSTIYACRLRLETIGEGCFSSGFSIRPAAEMEKEVENECTTEMVTNPFAGPFGQYLLGTGG